MVTTVTLAPSFSVAAARMRHGTNASGRTPASLLAEASTSQMTTGYMLTAPGRNADPYAYSYGDAATATATPALRQQQLLRHSHSNSNSYVNPHGNSDCHGNCDANGNSDGNSDCHSNCDANLTPTGTATATATATATGTATATPTTSVTPTPSEAPCAVSDSEPRCNSTVFTPLTDFYVYITGFVNSPPAAERFYG